jgi:repressor LexA
MFGKKLRELRKMEGWTQEEVARKIGVSKQTYSHYENEKRKPSLDTIRKLAEIYDVALDTVFGTVQESKEEYTVPVKFVRLPIVGQISCGNGTVAYEEIEGYEAIPESWTNGGEYFFLRAKGDSMINARIQDGDLLLIRRQDDVENGDIAAVYIDGEAVLKRVYKTDNMVILHPENPKYSPILVTPDKNIKILGKLKRVIMTF